MRLDDLPAGATFLLDANVLIYARLGMSAQCWMRGSFILRTFCAKG